MNVSIASTLLQIISAAVTPVVMISACAALILGINNKHTGISDRIRAFTAECRRSETTQERKVQLKDQICIFFRRFKLTWFALAALYMAVGAFACMILLIILTQRKMMTFENGTLTLFIVGTTLMLVAAGLEFMEVWLSIQSLRLEMCDVVPEALQRKR